MDQDSKLAPPPGWLHCLFLAVATLGAIRLTTAGAGVDLRPLLAASLVMLFWLGYAQRT
jgi:hypothetical protein